MSFSEITSVSQNNHSFKKRKIELKEDNYRRDSFDDRFCDDLCEEILQYLSVEDKFRLEGVSKQFQRTVFHDVYELNLVDTDFLTEKLDKLIKKFQRLDCLQKLKRFSVVLCDFDFRLLLPELKAFPALKTLKLWTDYTCLYSTFSFEAFEGFSNITHLTLRLCLYSKGGLYEARLKNIDINLPNLQYLEIIDTFDTTPKGVKQMADILSRLSRLETLKLKFKSGVDFKPIEEQITKKCRKIKEIKIGSVSDKDSDNYLYLNFNVEFIYPFFYEYNYS